MGSVINSTLAPYAVGGTSRPGFASSDTATGPVLSSRGSTLPVQSSLLSETPSSVALASESSITIIGSLADVASSLAVSKSSGAGIAVSVSANSVGVSSKPAYGSPGSALGINTGSTSFISGQGGAGFPLNTLSAGGVLMSSQPEVASVKTGSSLSSSGSIPTRVDISQVSSIGSAETPTVTVQTSTAVQYHTVLPIPASSLLQSSITGTSPAYVTVKYYTVLPLPASTLLQSLPTETLPGYVAVPESALSATPVYTPEILGNAYGGGFPVNASLFVSPVATGTVSVVGGIPPGYGYTVLTEGSLTTTIYNVPLSTSRSIANETSSSSAGKSGTVAIASVDADATIGSPEVIAVSLVVLGTGINGNSPSTSGSKSTPLATAFRGNVTLSVTPTLALAFTGAGAGLGVSLNLALGLLVLVCFL
ncbi:MAG: hypothetical protein M1819_000547 [Sarea resinae]|nr:MAG: hypothetical protein M1819_000547 [Sarea resinae]